MAASGGVGILLGHLLLNVLQELLVGRGRLGAILHQVLEQSGLGRSIVPAGRRRGQRRESVKREQQLAFYESRMSDEQ